MNLPFLVTPAQILQAALVAGSQGLMPVTPQPAVAVPPWPVYATNEPSDPDNVITVYDTQGIMDARAMVDGSWVEHVGLQFRVRSTDHPTGGAVAESLKDWLDQMVCQMAVPLGEATYVIWNMSRTSPVLALGRNVPASQRSLFTLNYVSALSRTI